MAIIWVDPYRGINESYKCHGTTGTYSSRDGSYANPYAYDDLWTRYYGSSGAGRLDPVGLSTVTLGRTDEIRIKGEPIDHIWLDEQAWTNNSQSIYSFISTGTVDTGFTNGQKTHMLFEPYSTSNSAKNYDAYNTSRPIVSNSLAVTINGDGTMSTLSNNLHDMYWVALSRSLYSSVGSTLTLGARLLDPAFMGGAADIPQSGASTTTNYFCGVYRTTSNQTNEILVTDRWSSETTQSNDYYSFCFGRPYTQSGSAYFRNYVAHKAPNTFHISVDNNDTQSQSAINQSRWYDYGAGSDYYRTNQDTFDIGGILGHRYFYYYRNLGTSVSYPTPTTETYGLLSNNTYYFYMYSSAWQSQTAQNTDYHCYFRHISGSGETYYWNYQWTQSTSTTVTRTYHFGDHFFRSLNTHNTGSGFSGPRDKVSVEQYSTWYFENSGDVAFRVQPPHPSCFTWNGPVYNRQSVPWDQADGTSTIAAEAQPAYGVEVALETASGAANLIDYNATNWYDMNFYTWTRGQATGQYMWYGELQVPANTALENFTVPTAAHSMAPSVSNHYMGTFTTNIPGDDRTVFFAECNNGAVMCYVNSDGDLDVRPMPDSSGNYPSDFTILLFLPIDSYVDSSGNATSLGPIPILMKSYHGSGDYYQNYSYGQGTYTSSGWTGSTGGSGSATSTTLNSTDWWKKTASYNANEVSLRLPGPYTTPPGAPVDNIMWKITWSNPSGNNFVSGYKMVFRVVPPDEWGDY